VSKSYAFVGVKVAVDVAFQVVDDAVKVLVIHAPATREFIGEDLGTSIVTVIFRGIRLG